MSKPNIILVAGCQHRLDCTGYAGHPAVNSPNLDALARGGAWFSAAEAAGVEASDSLRALVRLDTLGELRAAGYRIGYAGPPIPHLDVFSYTRTAPMPGEPGPTDYGRWLEEQGHADHATLWSGQGIAEAPSAYRAHFGAMRSALPAQDHVLSWLGDKAVRFVRAALEPFCLVVCFPRPGEPYDPPAMVEWPDSETAFPLPVDSRLPVVPRDAARCPRFDFAGMTEPHLRRALAHYYASITLLDHQVGRVLATLQSRGLTQNLIAYTALMGELAGHRGLVGGGDPALFPILRRVPLVVAGARGLDRGRHDTPADTSGLLRRLTRCAVTGAWPEGDGCG